MEEEEEEGNSTDPDVHFCCLVEGSAYRSLKLQSAFLSHHPGVHTLEGFSFKCHQAFLVLGEACLTESYSESKDKHRAGFLHVAAHIKSRGSKSLPQIHHGVFFIKLCLMLWHLILGLTL